MTQTIMKQACYFIEPQHFDSDYSFQQDIKEGNLRTKF